MFINHLTILKIQAVFAEIIEQKVDLNQDEKNYVLYMLTTLLKTTILAENDCCIFECHQWENLLSSKTLTNCERGGGGGGGGGGWGRGRGNGAFMLFVTK